VRKRTYQVKRTHYIHKLKGSNRNETQNIATSNVNLFMSSFKSVIEGKEVKRVILAIDPRKQWENGHGYCGETSIQSIGILSSILHQDIFFRNICFFTGLYYGCWISQQLIRSINEGEVLITDDENDAATLARLHFDFERWPFENEHEPQFKRYCAWLKHHLIQQHPCIIAVYLDDDNDDDKSDEYDHIMPAIGIQYSDTATSYDSSDVLLFYNLFDLKLLERQLSVDDMIKTRNACKSSTEAGGSLPRQINYGYAILGIKDNQRATMPVHLKVNLPDEPNLSMGAQPILMQGTISVCDLELDRHYVLLRYNSYKQVPISGDAQEFLCSRYHKQHEFRANSCTYSYIDPEGIPSNGSTYYRCVPSKSIN
jgi:hypothetical protein